MVHSEAIGVYLLPANQYIKISNNLRWATYNNLTTANQKGHDMLQFL